MKYRSIFLFILFTIPLVSSAQIFQEGDSFKEIIKFILMIVGYLMQTIFALISLFIIWTTFKYINSLRGGDSKAADEYKRILIGAVIGLAVAFSLWGIIEIISNTLGFGAVGIPQFTAPK